MNGFILQVQLLLAALSAALPLAPEGRRAQLVQVLETIAVALKLGEAAVDLAAKFAALRAEIEQMAALGEAVDAERLEAAFARVRAASAALRTAATASAAP